MSKSAIMKRALGEKLKKHGFKYDGYSYLMWVFKRVNENGVEQYIGIQKSRFEKRLYLNIYTSVRPVAKRFEQFAPKESKIDTNWNYHTDEDFEKIMEQLAELIEKYCIPKFEELSIPEYFYLPTKEMQQMLYNNHAKLAEKFALKYDLSSDLNVKDCLATIEKIINEISGENYDDVKELLIEMAAFYAEQFVKEFGGKWRMNDKCAIHKLGPPISCVFILSDIFRAWEKTCCDRLHHDYKSLKGFRDAYGYRP